MNCLPVFSKKFKILIFRGQAWMFVAVEFEGKEDFLK